jgi:FKBP-type peptidyl-prolyl cis-trans isomerase
MKKNLMFLAIAAIALSSCGGGFKQGPGGMLYNIHEDKAGTNIKEGDFISVNLIVKTEGDSVLTNTYTQGRAVPTLMPKPQFKGDIYAGLNMLSEGDSATFKCNIDSMIKAGQPKPPFKGKYIIFQVKVEKVIPKGKMTDSAFQNLISAYFKDLSEQYKKEEPIKMKKYIADNKLNVITTSSGLNYEITKKGNGPTPVAGDTVVVNYTLKSLNNDVIETSIKEEAQKAKKYNPMGQYKPIRIPVGSNQVIPGWEEGLMLMNKGSKATFVIPSSLAYGEQGMGQAIAPYTSLVFDIELVDIVKPDPNAPKPKPVMPSMEQMQQMQQQMQQHPTK